MKAIVTDAAALRAVRPPDLLEYLRARGWTPFERDPESPMSEWSKDGATGYREVQVPMHPEWRDYARRIQAVLAALAEEEGRSQLEVIGDLSNAVESRH